VAVCRELAVKKLVKRSVSDGELPDTEPLGVVLLGVAPLGADANHPPVEQPVSRTAPRQSTSARARFRSAMPLRVNSILPLSRGRPHD
jgi:hypothetical protein